MKNYLIWLAVGVLLFEEWLWEILQIWGQAISELLYLQQIEAYLENSTPYVALVAIMIPVTMVAPLNWYALLLLADGEIVTGVALEFFAKIVGTLMISRVFVLTKPQLLTIPAFDYVYGKIITALHWAHVKIKKTKVYAKALELKAQGKMYLQLFKKKLSF